MDPSGDLRPLRPVLPDFRPPARVNPAWLAALHGSESYRRLLRQFDGWPRHSFMTVDSRAVLFALIRAARPQVVAEIGTLFAGTTEVLARALWENGAGVVHTTDPFGAERCPAAIAAWPAELRAITHFHALNSMDFLARLDQQRVPPDLVLVDGNHDYEFALFDLLMTARLARPGALIVMDNAEQSGPFRAAREFLAGHPAWRELGGAVAAYNPSQPFDTARSSLPGTTFVVLQGPAHLAVGPSPASWGNKRIEADAIDGFALDLPPQTAAGTLHFQAIFRAFGDGNRAGLELKEVGRLDVDLAARGTSLQQRFAARLDAAAFRRFADAAFTFEIDLAWEARGAAASLMLGGVPQPFGPGLPAPASPGGRHG